MTDTTVRRTPAAVPCHYREANGENCVALIPDTDEDRRTHRAWHDSERAYRRGFRDAISERDRIIERALARIDELAQRIDDFGRDIDNIEIPDTVEPLRINEWPDDEDEDDLDDEPIVTVSPAIDRDDLYTGPSSV